MYSAPKSEAAVCRRTGHLQDFGHGIDDTEHLRKTRRVDGFAAFCRRRQQIERMPLFFSVIERGHNRTHTRIIDLRDLR